MFTIDESGNVYKTTYYQDGSTITQSIGASTKSETIRIDNNTVVDLTYEFDLSQEKYVEKSRNTRTETLVTELSQAEQLALLQETQAAILFALVSNDLM